MTVKATKFTPEVLLTAPRRSAGVPNLNASQILYQVSTYSFEKHDWHREIRVLDAGSKESRLVTDAKGASEPTWVDGDGSVLLLVPGEKGVTDVIIGKVGDWDKTKYTAGTIDASVSGVKLQPIDKDTYAIVVAAPTSPDGSLFNSEKAPKAHTSGRLYSALFVRHWDTWTTPQRNALWYGTLSASTRNSTSGGKYSLSKLINALNDPSLESPIAPFGGTDNYDLSISGIAFVSKDPELNPATHTKQNLYIVPRTNSSGFTLSKPIKITITGLEGATTNPTFSPNGRSLAFTSMREDGYESDKNQLLVIPDVQSPERVERFFTAEDGKGRWDRSPSGIAWSKDSKTLYVQAEDHGRGAIFSLPSNTNEAQHLPAKLFTGGSPSGFKVLSNGELFISGTSLIDNSAFYLFDPSSTASGPHLISSNSKEGSAFGLSRDQVDEIWYDGEEVKNHAWVIKPSNFKKGEKYPLAFLIHGGPQGAWEDSWSTRWNPAVFAEQGYVVVTPNPTGSTGYGQDLTDAIQNQWGGLPYKDLVKAFEYIESELDYVDTSRSVCLGASYGGYMTNWIQGQPLGRKFKALVTHDGVFSMTGQLASEELYFPFREFGGKLWDEPQSWAQWDPSRFTENWDTPHLIIHSEKDYRLTISEGLSAFNTLQVRGVESQFLTFPEENHWVLKPENSLLWHKVVLDWINPRVGLPKWGDDGVAGKLLKEAVQDAGATGAKL